MKVLLSIIICFPLLGSAQLRMGKIFSDNMILQRDKPVHVWGKATPGSTVIATFAAEERSTIVKPDASWDVYFSKQKANARPQSIIVLSGNEKIELSNILMGDIWICFGQSNMEFPMRKEMHFRQESSRTDQPLIHFYNPWFAGKYLFGKLFTDSVRERMNAQEFFQGQWQHCDSSTVKEMSAIGYYFAKEITAHENIPVGMINLSIGGAPIEAFISRETLASDHRFASKVQGDWLINDALPVWARQRGKENIGAGNDTDPSGPAHPFKPGFAYAAGIEPILGLPVSGMLWYQGESNSQELPRVQEYGELLRLLIADYRRRWHEPRMPFYWVQLSSIDTTHYQSRYWPEFRNEQRRLLSSVNDGGMAVCSDIGFKNDVHPTDKKTVGERLSRWALNKTYKRNILPSGPLPLKAKYKGGNIIITFQYTGNSLQTPDGQKVNGFSLDGITDVPAIIKNKTIIIPSQYRPEYIYYGWKPFSDANLYNSDMLPASTFKLKVQ